MRYALVQLELQKDGTYIVGGALATGATPELCKRNFMLQARCDPADFNSYAAVCEPLLMVPLA